MPPSGPVGSKPRGEPAHREVAERLLAAGVERALGELLDGAAQRVAADGLFQHPRGTEHGELARLVGIEEVADQDALDWFGQLVLAEAA